ncbi:P-loop containing nucleoside triphosphate hydrolase protein [Suillus bovinus]|uniref:P-loop containing nucleoside triphosphate hydrolase protein n=1 Tax=Suillus bovinus TaxID=48563 RepID=UPI001B865761|nr:P-loop containing nucleoside triphosphate hydrolase protein [Suillus bovinus]KAG2133197.1 P-loop containing nucleoside triphosphate hydrolase protein [Suillus bovinus]
MTTLLEPPGIAFRPLSPPPRRYTTHSTSPQPHSRETTDKFKLPVVTQTAHGKSQISAPAASLSQYETENYLDAEYMIEESASDEGLTDTESITDTDDDQTEGNFYVIRVGHRPAHNKSPFRMEAARQIVNFPGAIFKSYHTKREAKLCSFSPAYESQGLIIEDEKQTVTWNAPVCRQYFQCALARIQAEKESLDATADGEECPICMDTFTEARITACGHTFCRECVASVLNTPFVQDAQDPRKYRSNEMPCPSCRAPISADVIFIREAFEPTDTELSGDVLASSDDEMPEISEMILQGSKGKGRARRIRKKCAVCDSDDESEDDDDDDMSDFIVEDGEDEEEKDARRNIKKRLRTRRAIVVESDDELDADERDVVIGRNPRQVPASTGEVRMMSRFLPSTKMNHMIEHLEKWAKQYPGDKTIIISQWTECLKLVSDFLVEKKVPHVKYQGSMSRSQRDQAVRVFMTGNTAQVMLMSLKCGGVGLNLIFDSPTGVISLDLGWSEAIESQAFDRVHRLGQQKDVFVHRLVIANTVEDRVLALQERKLQRNLADGSLGEGSGKKIGRMSVRELANLFGLDHRGNLL